MFLTNLIEFTQAGAQNFIIFYRFGLSEFENGASEQKLVQQSMVADL